MGGEAGNAKSLQEEEGSFRSLVQRLRKRVCTLLGTPDEDGKSKHPAGSCFKAAEPPQPAGRAGSASRSRFPGAGVEWPYRLFRRGTRKPRSEIGRAHV